MQSDSSFDIPPWDAWAPDEDALDRYLAGESPVAEHARITEWLGEHAESAGRLAAVGVEADIAVVPEDADSAERVSGRFFAQIQLPRAAYDWNRFGNPRKSGGALVRRNTMFRNALVASLGAVLLMMEFGWWFSQSGPSAVPNEHVYTTTPGQQQRVQLSKSSVVTLAPASTLRITPDAVLLDGEAYFEIVSRPNRPFVVKTANAAVQVLGTRFTVRHYSSDRGSRVVVEEGKVTLRSRRAQVSADAQTVLTAHMLGEVVDSVVTVVSGVAVNNYIGWIQGRLVFNEVRFGDVAAELARAYGVEIRLTDSTLARQPMTLKVSVKEQPLSQVLELLGIAANAQHTRTDDTIVFRPGRTTTQRPNVKHFSQPERLYGK